MGLFGRLVFGSVRTPARRRATALLLGGVALALIVVALAVVPRFEIRLDPAMILFGVAAVILAWAVYLAVSKRPAASETVTVSYDLRVAQPAFPGGRHRFELQIFYEVEARGRRERERQARIELLFRAGDHPDLLEWTSAQVGAYVKAHRRLAAKRHPDARIVTLPILARGRSAEPTLIASQDDPPVDAVG